MHLIIKIGFLFPTLLLSCLQQKYLIQDQLMYWEGNQVSDDDALLLAYTLPFVRNYRADTPTTSTPHHEN